jgi:hypothetical protein
MLVAVSTACENGADLHGKDTPAPGHALEERKRSNARWFAAAD